MNRPQLKYGDKNKDVREYKGGLCALDYIAKGDVNDEFDKLTKSVTELFQADEGLEETGIVDEETWNALNKKIGEKASARLH